MCTAKTTTTPMDSNNKNGANYDNYCNKTAVTMIAK